MHYNTILKNAGLWQNNRWVSKMPRKTKGLERRISYGKNGPKFETLVKTVTKTTARDSRRAGRKYGMNFGKIRTFVVKRRFKSDSRIAIARAMDAIGLDPKKPTEKKVRAEIQKMSQKMSELQYETNFNPDSRRDVNVHAELQKTITEMAQTIADVKGPEALDLFEKIYRGKMTEIQIAHEEAARNSKRRGH